MSAFKECPGGSNVLPAPRGPVAELEEIRELTCSGGILDVPLINRMQLSKLLSLWCLCFCVWKRRDPGAPAPRAFQRMKNVGICKTLRTVLGK